MAIESQAILVSKNFYHKVVKYFGKENKNKPEQSSKLPVLPEETRGISTDVPLLLIDIFKEEVKYHSILKILVEQKVISPVTHHWIDFGKGNKKLIVVIIKKLWILGYCKSNQNLTHLQIQDICLNTFGVNVSIDHIKHTKYDDIKINYLPSSYQVLISPN